jgi:thiamine-monophosphate kinase
MVVTTDMLMEGVDFQSQAVTWQRIGRKSLAVNLSDLAAMAAEPVAAFISLALPRSGGRRIAEELYEGLLPLANEFGVGVAGGDTNSWDGPLVVCVTATGYVNPRGPLLRSGARPGDDILVTGSLGGSILGRQFDFCPRVREALWLHQQFNLRAGIDISDGLLLDLSRLAEASGCGAEVELAHVPVSPDAERLAAARADNATALDHALSDGEDFELLFAVSPEESRRILATPSLPVPITRIGRFVEQPGLWALRPDGIRDRMSPRGYEHVLT